MIGKGLAWVFRVSVLCFILSAWNRNSIPENLIFDSRSLLDPTQRATSTQPFDVSYGGVNYRVDPQFSYTLTGLVVSLRQHDGDRMLHKLWNDHLNVTDICVIWGDNLANDDIALFHFENRQFTCFFRTRDTAAWNRFNPRQISNNHLISGDDYIRGRLEDIRIGDQIELHGVLASYGHSGGFERGTSTVRTDTGNGACETIYVESVEVPLRAPPGREAG